MASLAAAAIMPDDGSSETGIPLSSTRLMVARMAAPTRGSKALWRLQTAEFCVVF